MWVVGALRLLKNGQKEWQSKDHPFVEVLSYDLRYRDDLIVSAQTSSVDGYNHPPIPFVRIDGHVKVQTDNGCIFNYLPEEFAQIYKPFVRTSAWERLLND